MEINNHKISLKPKEPMPKLKYNEIGVRSDLKGFQIKNLIDKIIFFLIYKKYSSVILKSRAKGISKLISIIDILQRKILGLYVKQETYSTTYINTQDQNKEIKFPCMDAIFTLKETEGFSQPRNINELESNFIDPKNPPDFRSIKGNNNNNFNNNNYNNNNIKHRGRDNNGRVFRPGFRGRFFNRGNRGIKNVFRGRNIYNNNYGNNNNFNTNYSNNNNNNNNNNYINNRQNNNYNQGRRFIKRGRGIRRIIRGNRGNNNNMIMRYNNVRKDDEDYREFKGYNNIKNNNNYNQNNKINNFNNNYNKNTNFNNSEKNFHSTPHFYNSNNLNNNNSNQTNNNNSNENLRNSNNSMRGNNMRGMSNLRGRGKVLEMIGRGLPMRGKLNGME